MGADGFPHDGFLRGIAAGAAGAAGTAGEGRTPILGFLRIDSCTIEAGASGTSFEASAFGTAFGTVFGTAFGTSFEASAFEASAFEASAFGTSFEASAFEASAFRTSFEASAFGTAFETMDSTLGTSGDSVLDRMDSTERGGADDASDILESAASGALEGADDASDILESAASGAGEAGGDSGLTDGREKLESEESSEDDDILSIDNDFLSKRFRTRVHDVYHSPEPDESSS